jgi:hypothetical protein
MSGTWGDWRKNQNDLDIWIQNLEMVQMHALNHKFSWIIVNLYLHFLYIYHEKSNNQNPFGL